MPTLIIISYQTLSRGTVYWSGSSWVESAEEAKFFQSANEVRKEMNKNSSLRTGTFFRHVEATPARVHRMKLGANSVKFNEQTQK
jgi:hypothetical protein